MRRADLLRWSGGLGVVLTLVGAVWFYRWWSRPPAVEFDNLKYIQMLRTAVSARRADYVSGVERAVHLRRKEGAMSPAEAAHFESILTLVRSGEWERAEQRAFDFELAQANRQRTRARSDEP
jgi:hypothetical protein